MLFYSYDWELKKKIIVFNYLSALKRIKQIHLGCFACISLTPFLNSKHKKRAAVIETFK